MRSVRVKGYYENLVTAQDVTAVRHPDAEKDVWDPVTQLYTITGTGHIDIPLLARRREPVR